MGNPYAPLSSPRQRNVITVSAPVAETAPETVTEEEIAVTEEVPEGTISEIKKWVGDDVDRAQVALNKENASDDPRVTLVAYLEALVTDESE